MDYYTSPYSDYRYRSTPRWFVKLVSDSTAEPVATTDIKRQINLPTTSTGDDLWIASAITTARKMIERRVPGGVSLINQTWDMVIDRFPPGDARIEIPYPPLGSITSITYFDANNSSTTLASTDYQLFQPYQQPGFVKPAYQKAWPGCTYRPNAVTVRFVAGFGSAAANVPAPYKHAIQMLAAHWFEHREAAMQQIPQQIEFSIDALIGSQSWGYYG